ncbi:MAG: hypothetical protein H0W40_10030 [Methylibium sp.]|uniref:ribbon-helix-helix domain-containing protein n=1 Tax=Methylibium sp. TaxID=2067992 RepID=UPI001840182E|nr:hypothetical protein [Methylibium sp.]MBA3597702.1 hypothetical protein [Methylibium sp.]
MISAVAFFGDSAPARGLHSRRGPALQRKRSEPSTSTDTWSFALPEALRCYVDEGVHFGRYDNMSGYLSELIRQDQDGQGNQRLRELIEEGFNSGWCLEVPRST